jgi:hypothetical protein
MTFSPHVSLYVEALVVARESDFWGRLLWASRKETNIRLRRCVDKHPFTDRERKHPFDVSR